LLRFCCELRRAFDADGFVSAKGAYVLANFDAYVVRTVDSPFPTSFWIPSSHTASFAIHVSKLAIMSEPRGSSVDGIIDFTDPNTPPPQNAVEDENNEENDTPIRSERSGRKASPRGGANAALAGSTGALTAANTAANGGPPKWGCQTVYLRVMGRKPGPNSNELNLVKPFKPMNYSIMGLFSKESNEVQLFFSFLALVYHD
jgi:hypothetical protein